MTRNRLPKTTILKFGGTSVSSHDSVNAIVRIVKRILHKRPVLVISALSGVTEALLSLPRDAKLLHRNIRSIRETHAKLTREIFRGGPARDEVIDYVDEQLEKAAKVAVKEKFTPEDKDELVSFGEIMSSFIVSRALRLNGIKAEQVVATSVIVTDDSFTHAEFLPKETRKKTRKVLAPLIALKKVPVITGFLGSTRNGRTTTLGRGGSDYSASIIGRSLDSREIQIWTDVDGIFTADPRVVRNAEAVKKMCYREASEMAAFGAKVLHPRTARPAIEKNIPMRVLNTFNPKVEGTLVGPHSPSVGLKAIAFKRKVVLVNIYSGAMLFSRGFLARVFEMFAHRNISVDLVSVSEVSVTVTLDNSNHLSDVIAQLRKFSKVSVDEGGFGVVALIGEKISRTPNLMRDVFSLLQKDRTTLKMISMGASDINVSLVIPSSRIVRTVKAIHNHFIDAAGASRASRSSYQ